ncbi:hypothetical protein N9F48_03030 [Akkermansiaceae bacterium]|nr:hypothetical protein [Akkermansiaceae bacterium]MDA7935149.1 hypothetical protein [Akkermansiaceae bacterium]MDA8969022.1 hypothetical protein [Akkermansiaceae bacterium]MDA8975482.1 hypothetical protein [Akkermansiaceae bacterium]MDB4412187.1 hypothetical protein [Akkermansiaceae bacterium]
MISEAPIIACSTCANAFKHAGGDAGGWAIAVMLMCIVPLVSGVLFLMIRMARREKLTLDPQYMDDYVPPRSNS